MEKRIEHRAILLHEDRFNAKVAAIMVDKIIGLFEGNDDHFLPKTIKQEVVT